MKSAKKVKAAIMFADYGELSVAHSTSLNPTKRYSRDQPVAVIPLTAEAYDAMVEQMTRAILANWDEGVVGFDCVQHLARENAKAALRAIGITSPKQSKQ